MMMTSQQDTYLYSPLFLANELGEMRRGEVTLSVPVKNNVIQVGVDSIDETGEILVKKGWRGVTIKNTDGSPIQVEVIDDVTPDRITTVLKEPVAEIKFRKKRDLIGQVCWFADGEGVNINDKAAITRFAGVVGKFAVTKQGGVLSTRY